MGDSAGGSGALQFFLSRRAQSLLVVGCIFAFIAVSFLPYRQYRGAFAAGVYLDTEHRGVCIGRDHGFRRGFTAHTGKSYTDQTILQLKGAGESASRVVCEKGGVFQREDFFARFRAAGSQQRRCLRGHGIPNQYSGKPQYTLYRRYGSGGRVVGTRDFLSNATLSTYSQKGFPSGILDGDGGQRASSTTRNTKGLVLYRSWVRLGLCLQMASHSRIPRDKKSCFRIPISVTTRRVVCLT